MFASYLPSVHGVPDPAVLVRPALADDMPGIAAVASSRGSLPEGWSARESTVFSVINTRNGASLDLHRRHGFTEVARAARIAGVSFEGGSGVLLRRQRKE